VSAVQGIADIMCSLAADTITSSPGTSMYMVRTLSLVVKDREILKAYCDCMKFPITSFVISGFQYDSEHFSRR
jgi:hypothetical protein